MRRAEAARVPLGDHVMLRNILLSTLAAATLAGCATGYSYRNGDSGDYYYGQPRTEYRYNAPYGYYGSFGYGSYGSGYYYDRYGRLVYGNPYGYYGYPYGAGSWWYQRPPHGHGGHDHDGDGDQDVDHPDRKPPWRDLGRIPRTAGEDGDDMRPRQRRQPTPMTMPSPQLRERPATPSMPRMRSDDSGGSRMGRVIRNARGSAAADE